MKLCLKKPIEEPLVVLSLVEGPSGIDLCANGQRLLSILPNGKLHRTAYGDNTEYQQLLTMGFKFVCTPLNRIAIAE